MADYDNLVLDEVVGMVVATIASNLDSRMVRVDGPAWLNNLCKSRQEPKTTLSNRSFIMSELKRADSIIPYAWNLAEDEARNLTRVGEQLNRSIESVEGAPESQLQEMMVHVDNIYALLKLEKTNSRTGKYSYATHNPEVKSFNHDVTASKSIVEAVESSTQVTQNIKQPTQGKLRKMKLSAKYSDLIDRKTGISIRTRFGYSQTSFIDEWLNVRPEGGRIFIDLDGNAWTTMSVGLVLLGNVAHLKLENLDD